MSITITDPQLLAELSHGDVELKGPDGRLLGHFVAGENGKLPPMRPLIEVLKKLHQQPVANGSVNVNDPSDLPVLEAWLEEIAKYRRERDAEDAAIYDHPNQ